MKPNTPERLAAWTAESRQVGFRRRNWRAVRLLATLTVTLLLTGLMGEYRWSSGQLAHACWIAAAIAGTAMLIWFMDDRLFIEQPPTPG